MKNKCLTCLFLGLLLAGETVGQSVQWAVRPTSAQIEGYGHLLKIRKGGKCGLIDHNNCEIIPAKYDSISPFRDGYALAMNARGNQLKIEAVISDGDYDLQPLTETVYATNYMWFSDGKMPVKGTNGWGYLGTDGNMVIPCQFQTAYPFSEGFASVLMDDKAYYIDRNMDYLPVEAGYGNLVFASTFSGEEAVVYSGNSYTPKGYVINRRGRIIRSYKTKPSDLRVNKYDHSIGDKTQKFKEQVQQLQEDNRYSVFQENGLYGYKKNGQLVLPAQLDIAEPVRGSYANVRFKGQNGVLRMVDGSFSMQMESNQIEVVDGQASRGYLQLGLPSSLEDANIRLRMTDRQGHDMLMQANVAQGRTRSYSFMPGQVPQSDRNTSCVLEVWNDNLLLWKRNCDISYHVTTSPKNEEMADVPDTKKKKDPEMTIAYLTISPPKATAKKANPKNDFYVTVTVSNEGDMRGNASVVLYVDGQQIGVKNIGVRGHGRANALFAVSGVRKERYAKVKAILKNGRGASHEANIHFMPFN